MKRAFFLCVFLIAYFTLHPWTFVPFHEHSSILTGFQPLSGEDDYLDVVVNLCFYMPLGMLGVLAWWTRSRSAVRWIAVTAVGVALSCTLEILQAWVPTRDSSILDVLTNTIGAALGAAVGLANARRLSSRARRGLPLTGRPVPAVLIAAWLASQLFPFLPIMRTPRFTESLQALMQARSVGGMVLADAFVTALLVGRLLREVFTASGYRATLVVACLVLPARLFLDVGAVPWPVSVAFAAGLLVSHTVLGRMRAETGFVAAIAVLAIVVRELQPFHFSNTASAFYWIPFSGFLGASRDAAIRVSAEKFLLYGGTVWMIREAGVSLWMAATAVGALLLAGESAQRFMPGRIAESTDAALAVTAACVMAWLKDRPARSAASAPPR